LLFLTVAILVERNKLVKRGRGMKKVIVIKLSILVEGNNGGWR